MSAFTRIPSIAQPFVSEKTLDLTQLGEGDQRWNTYPSVIESLKTKARQLGLWNMFLPKNHYSQGAGFTNLEYGLMAEYLDTGNMEVLAKYGNEAQKQQWLAPLLDSQIRSAFLDDCPEQSPQQL
ncbi:acyl-CoA dehydrogenase family protein [Aspergillus nomiae NRRL 13137]|uniref:Acyl-CoA dehydrogenase family protein n=1 Tax=Aspergillus nomiae NRRL (strain ATCC 15546 / NRRL 13137 / CBS 260.88 / M93) TaxID=1509407 RepID=A0A0L1IZQ2_ASPN3|nr:acyl-CoA dehydrogenase family protein [Aspergillus nomiae NRRL 13137]KNG84957.1 acyl-CoA dehydrogenase family protein [Aspergillus nomiae NRRL 13137]